MHIFTEPLFPYSSSFLPTALASVCILSCSGLVQWVKCMAGVFLLSRAGWDRYADAYGGRVNLGVRHSLHRLSTGSPVHPHLVTWHHPPENLVLPTGQDLPASRRVISALAFVHPAHLKLSAPPTRLSLSSALLPLLSCTASVLSSDIFRLGHLSKSPCSFHWILYSEIVFLPVLYV